MQEGSEGAVILLVDEADALAASRETPEMHHEEVSAVNAFIRGIDRLANRRMPAAVIMCTNRYDAIDPAVTRRAAEILVFGRPDEETRRSLLSPKLCVLGFDDAEIDAIVVATGERNGRAGFTFSDLTQRLIPRNRARRLSRPLDPSEPGLGHCTGNGGHGAVPRSAHGPESLNSIAWAFMPGYACVTKCESRLADSGAFD